MDNSIKVGNKYGAMEVLEVTNRKFNDGTKIIVCRCNDCGTIKETRAGGLKTGRIISCGCNKTIRGDEASYKWINKSIGNAIVTGMIDRKVKLGVGGKRLFECLCDCGKTFEATGQSLRVDKNLNCGCKIIPTHGLSDTPEYFVWKKLIDRCYNPNSHNYKNYGARGITVCERWRDPVNGLKNFIEDVGRRLNNTLSIERRNNNGNYEPSNCYWGTGKEQSNNTRNNRWIKFDNVDYTIALLADKLEIVYKKLNKRICYYTTKYNLPELLVGFTDPFSNDICLVVDSETKNNDKMCMEWNTVRYLKFDINTMKVAGRIKNVT